MEVLSLSLSLFVIVCVEVIGDIWKLLCFWWGDQNCNAVSKFKTEKNILTHYVQFWIVSRNVLWNCCQGRILNLNVTAFWCMSEFVSALILHFKTSSQDMQKSGNQIFNWPFVVAAGSFCLFNLASIDNTMCVLGLKEVDKIAKSWCIIAQMNTSKVNKGFTKGFVKHRFQTAPY